MKYVDKYLLILFALLIIMTGCTRENEVMDSANVSMDEMTIELINEAETESDENLSDMADAVEVLLETVAVDKDESSIIEPITIPILMYHHISDEVTHSGVITSEKFEKDIRMLQEEGYEGIFLKELYNYLDGNGSLPEKPILITFDDGYYSNYEFAYKTAKLYKMKITISMIGWSVGRSTFIDSEETITPHFGWSEAKEMLDSGLVDLQNHTFDLHSQKGESYGYGRQVNQGVLPLVDENFEDYKLRLSEDILTLNNLMKEHLDIEPEFMCYPYSSFNEDSEQVIKELGFLGSMSTIPGIRTYESLEDLWSMTRINISNDLEDELLLAEIKKYLPAE